MTPEPLILEALNHITDEDTRRIAVDFLSGDRSEELSASARQRRHDLWLSGFKATDVTAIHTASLNVVHWWSGDVTRYDASMRRYSISDLETALQNLESR